MVRREEESGPAKYAKYSERIVYMTINYDIPNPEPSCCTMESLPITRLPVAGTILSQYNPDFTLPCKQRRFLFLVID